MVIELSPGDGSSLSDISVQEAARDLKMVSIDVKSNFDGGLIRGQNALTPSVFELSSFENSAFCLT